MSVRRNRIQDSTSNTKKEYFSQGQLSLLRFKKHKLAVISFYVLLFIYFTALFAGFLAPYSPFNYSTNQRFGPPTKIHFLDEQGRLSRPFVYGYALSYDPDTYRETISEDPKQKFYLKFFVKGDEYKLLFLFKCDRHLLGTAKGGYVHLLGTDRASRDILSRMLYGAQISTSIGLIGVLVSFIIGIIIGGISGFLGGIVDLAIQRLIELIICIPTIPLWLVLASLIPVTWPVTRVYFMITIILSFVGWTGTARVVRSKFLSLRTEEYVKSARVAGAGTGRIIFVHMLPSFASHLIASLTLSIPGMILGECALSFLGLGMRAPAVSWGTMLQDAQDVRIIAYYPWLLYPALMIIITVIAFNFLGDGVRDAFDPHDK